MQPAVLVDRLAGGLLHLVVTAHDVVAPRAELALLVGGQRLPRLGVDDLRLDMGHRAAHRRDAQVEAVLGGGHRAGGRRLRLAVCNRDFPHTHLVHDKLHHLDRAGRARHDAGAQAREFIFVEGRMLEHRNEHRRNAVHGGALLVLEGLEHLGRAVGLDGDHRSRVGERRHDREHQAEAVEEGHADAELVVMGKPHAVADALAVVDDVEVGEHNALREPGRPRGVLHIDDLLRVDAVENRAELLLRHRVPHLAQVVPRVHPGGRGALADIDDVLEEGQHRIVVLARLKVLEGRAELVDNADIVRVLEALDHDERLGIRLPQQVFQLEHLVVGVDGDEHRADFGGRKEGQQPFGHVGRPDRHVVPLPDPHRQKSLCDAVDLVVKLPPGHIKGPVGIFDRLVVRIHLRDLLQQRADRNGY